MDDKTLTELLSDLDERRKRAGTSAERAEVASAISLIEHMYEDRVAA